MKIPFRHVDGTLYVQHDGVSMGSCLGPTFAEFYKSHVEVKLFQNDPTVKPVVYVRKVDDIYLEVSNIS